MTELQNRVLEIFKVIKEICDRNGLRYFAVGGTCIGTVRHHGFIPWDDDLDIAMPDSDYEKFFRVAQKELPDYLKVFYLYERKYNSGLFMKVHDLRTTFIENNEKAYTANYKGVFVDIFPISGMPDGKFEQKIFLTKTMLLIHLNSFQNKPFSSLSDIKRKAFWMIDNLWPQNYWVSRWKHYIGKFRFDVSEKVGFFFVVPDQSNIYPRTYFESYISMPFEDTTIRCPLKYDQYLTTRFGDYMTLPPVSERQNHTEGSLIDLDKPFSYYQKINAGK